MSPLRSALLKTLTFHDTWEHAPTRAELMFTLEWNEAQPSLKDIDQEIDALILDGTLKESFGRMIFPESEQRIQDIRNNELFAPRKRRAAQKIVRFLSRLEGVRFVALCNTTALGHARDEGDLDFFIVTKKGVLMQTRGSAALPFKLLNRRPGKDNERDTACFSYFVTDDGLDLSSHMLSPDDPYFRYWFLSLVPLFDDGVGQELWNANTRITREHALATRWIVPPDLRVDAPLLRFPTFRSLEAFADKLQRRAFPAAIREIQNQDTRVIVTGRALKFHVDDARADYRKRYEEACIRREITV